MQISQLLTVVNVWVLAKVMALFALALYLIFAGVVIKQVKLMRETINLGADEWVATIAWGHLLLAMVVSVGALFFL